MRGVLQPSADARGSSMLALCMGLAQPPGCAHIHIIPCLSVGHGTAPPDGSGDAGDYSCAGAMTCTVVFGVVVVRALRAHAPVLV